MASYGSERRPIGVRNTRAALDLAGSIAGIPLGPVLEADSAEGDRARATAADVLAGFAEESASLGVQLGARYDGSPIVVDDGTVPPPDLPAHYVPSACPGGRASHVRTPGGGSLFDAFDPGFTLLRLGTADGAGLVAAAATRAVPLTVVDVPGAAARDLYACDLALVRPDQHVAWRGNAAPVDPLALVDRIVGG